MVEFEIGIGVFVDHDYGLRIVLDSVLGIRFFRACRTQKLRCGGGSVSWEGVLLGVGQSSKYCDASKEDRGGNGQNILAKECVHDRTTRACDAFEDII